MFLGGCTDLWWIMVAIFLAEMVDFWCCLSRLMIGLGHPLVSLGDLCWILHFKLGFYKSDQSIFSFSNQILCSPC